MIITRTTTHRIRRLLRRGAARFRPDLRRVIEAVVLIEVLLLPGIPMPVRAAQEPQEAVFPSEVYIERSEERTRSVPPQTLTPPVVPATAIPAPLVPPPTLHQIALAGLPATSDTLESMAGRGPAVMLPGGFRSAEPQRLAAVLAFWATSYGQDADLMVRVAICESSLRPDARGAAGEIGVLQFMPSTFDEQAAKMGLGEHADIHDNGQQAQLAAWMWSQGRQRAWTCWRKLTR